MSKEEFLIKAGEAFDLAERLKSTSRSDLQYSDVAESAYSAGQIYLILTGIDLNDNEVAKLIMH